MKKPFMLMILDGFGLSSKTTGNAIAAASLPNINEIFKKYPFTTLKASGLAVGLPEGQMGNSEVGHLNIGAGRVVYQELTRISKAIDEGIFNGNTALLSAINHAGSCKTLHIMGLLSDGGVHSHIDHIKAVIRLSASQGAKRIYVHCFMDGRDVPPTSGIEYMKDLSDFAAGFAGVSVGVVSGRYYAMDRDNRWERVRLAYDALAMCKGLTASSGTEAVENAYAGDIIGLFDPGFFHLGDALSSGPKLHFSSIPVFAPEHFARVRPEDSMKRKQFLKGVSQLSQEGAIQIFRELGAGMESVIVGVVGVLQFEVLERRLKAEYRVEVRRQPLPYTDIRWIQNDPDTIDIPGLSLTRDTLRVEDMRGGKLLLFTSPWNVDWATDHNPDLILSEFGNVAF